MLALSVRQPWAWLAAVGYKDIENRTWTTKVRGRVFIHASKGMTGKELAEVCDFLRSSRALGHIPSPHVDDLTRGALIGAVDIVDCVTHSRSPWYMGAVGFQLANARLFDQPIPFTGRLGFFETGLEEPAP